jgi:hypothetical protein
MDSGLATVLGAAIGGSIGLVSALLSFLALRAQMRMTASEKEKDRDYQVLLTTMPKLLQALEEVWALLYSMQMSGHMTDEQIQRYIAATLWLPRDLRGISLGLIKEFMESPGDISPNVESLQDKIVSYSQKLRGVMEEDKND